MEPQIRNLTDRQVENSRATNGQRVDLRDAKPRGLMLRISPGGVKAWSVLYRRRLDGQRRRVTIGKYPQVSLADARAAALDVLARVARGEDPAGDRSRPRTDLPKTFGELADRYLDRHANRSKRSVRQDRQMLDKDLRPVLGKIPLETIKRSDIAAAIDRVVARGAPIQANRTFEIVRGLYNWALGAGLVETTPCVGLRAPSQEQSRERTLSPDEIRRFWQGLPQAKMSWATSQILRLCLVTGQRVSEVAGAQKSELDFSEHEWRLPGARVKNGNAHVVPLSPLAEQLFKEAIARQRLRHRDSPFVFPSPWTKAPIVGYAVARAMSRSLAVLKLADATPHDLRRTAATEMAKLGIARLVVDKVLNHVSADRSTIAGVYDRYSYAAEKRNALERWANRLLAIIDDIGVEASPGAN